MSSNIMALKQLRLLLTKKEKMKCLEVSAFAIISSFLELATALAIVGFARSLNQPHLLSDYLNKKGFLINLEPSYILFYTSLCVGRDLSASSGNFTF